MASTYSSGKMVTAFKAGNGKAYYIGYEKVCSSNTLPRNPKWHCYFIGDENDATKAIFEAASYIPGGMLKGANGRALNPETYIAGWMRELASPLMATELTIEMTNGGDWRQSWCSEAMENLRSKLTTIKTPKALEFLQCAEAGKTASLSLVEDIELILAVYGVEGLQGPAAVIKNGERQANAKPAPELGYAARKVKPTKNLAPSLISIGQTYPIFLAKDDEGVWRSVGREDCAMRSFIKQLGENELVEPGTYRHHIVAYRAALESAPLLMDVCDGIKVIIDTSTELGWMDQANLDSLLKEVPHTVHDGKVTVQLTFPGVHYSMIGYIPTDHSHWLVPDQLCKTAAESHTEQLELIA